MKNFLKIMLCIMGSFIALIVVSSFCIAYTVNYKKTTCDTSVSPDGKYELTLQAVGEPDWPFGSASGRLVLKEEKNKISQTDFELKNDGGSISGSCWKVTWYENYVEVILSGEEQSDERFILYFDGKIKIEQLIDKGQKKKSGKDQRCIDLYPISLVPDIHVKQDRHGNFGCVTSGSIAICSNVGSKKVCIICSFYKANKPSIDILSIHTAGSCLSIDSSRIGRGETDGIFYCIDVFRSKAEAVIL